MVLVLGVSAGAAGARAVLTHSDQPHLPPIDRATVARRPGGSVDEPVFRAIRLMHRAAERRDEFITGIAVTARNPVHAEAIRAGAGRSRLTIVDEPVAQLRYLRFSEQLPSNGAAVLYDLGAAGLTVTEIDCRTDALLAARRSTVLGGDAHDALVRQRMAHGGVTIDDATGRTYKEALAATPVLTVGDAHTESRMVFTRSDFGELVAAGIHHSVSFVRQLTDRTGVPAEALALLGGCTRNPGIRESLEHMLHLPVIYDPEPEFVSARGAVLMATELPAARRVRGGVRLAHTLRPVGETSVSRRKVAAALAATVALGGTVTGLLAADRHNPPPTTHGTVPAPFEVARSSEKPVPHR